MIPKKVIEESVNRVGWSMVDSNQNAIRRLADPILRWAFREPSLDESRRGATYTLAIRLRDALSEQDEVVVDGAVEELMTMPELAGWSDIPRRRAAERLAAAVRAADAKKE